MVPCCTSLSTSGSPIADALSSSSSFWCCEFFSVSRRVVKLAGLLLVADGAEMSLPTNGGTDRDALGSVTALAAHPFSSSSRPPSYSISRSQIVANGISRKRSLSGGVFATVSTIRGSTSTTATLPSLRYQLPAPLSAKRLRREPLSPTSVGEVSDAKKMPPAKSAVTTTPGAAQMQSMLRGLQHLSACDAGGCSNPLCVSTRTFVDKVKTHRLNMAGKSTHDANSPPWSEEPTAIRSSNHDSDEGQAIATEGQRSGAEQAWDDLLVVAFRAKQSEDVCQWEKEFSVFFDDSKPVGLGFQPASKSNKFSLVPAESYTCVVRDVAPVGLAADYNTRCRSAGDYSRIIVDKLRVRMVNGVDVANIPYADVLQMMRDGKPALTLTLTDISSGQVDTSLVERSRSLGSLASTRQTRRRSSLSMGPGKPKSRRDSQAGLESKSDCLQLPESTGSDADGSDTLVHNLKTEYLEVSHQLSTVREQLSALHQEREEAVIREQEVAARQLEALLQETRKVQRERDDMVAVNKLLLRHKRASTTTQAELEAVRNEQVQLQRHQDELEQTLTDLQAQLAEQTTVAEERREQVNHLRHDKEILALQWQELQEEHRDTQSQVDELHDRLVDAQRAHRAVEVVLAALRTSHAAKTQHVRELQAALETANSRAAISPLAKESRHIAKVSVAQPNATVMLQADTSPTLASSQLLQERLKDTSTDLNQHRDELLVELSCHDQQLQQLQEQVRALELVNSTSKQLLASLHEELRDAQSRERSMRGEFSAELEVVRKKVEQEAQITQSDLKRQISELELRCEDERTKKNRLQVAVDELESSSRARAAAQAREQEFLVQFKKQLENGIVVNKFGSRGVPHQRVVYADAQCHWLSWRSPATSATHSSLLQPKTDSKVDTCDLVEVLPGATTENFTRQRPDAPARCFSLVFVHPCRTLDLQADTAAQCQQYLRGFRLLQEEAALKRR
ncbi:hypothetical protein PC119_g8479 [Phytophthora cactorum]|uniref:PH domain-like n=1 Tax=Phytophthora cactorum TaxID=29920 RepID=A0A8T1CV16_9STRA|nr:hypothetical protein PC114_g8979 [Phytophthora cactorum]KAG2927299.1 hypothetical protein PC115_g7599 [Phytophthora cactorum]KAG3024425.1 hypothetical protein PC119_g8479 [Phytophthora cactorum]KAG3089099.1 hypothetical protein PC122_g8032 [Phytophthora cactorum]